MSIPDQAIFKITVAITSKGSYVYIAGSDPFVFLEKNTSGNVRTKWGYSNLTIIPAAITPLVLSKAQLYADFATLDINFVRGATFATATYQTDLPGNWDHLANIKTEVATAYSRGIGGVSTGLYTRNQFSIQISAQYQQAPAVISPSIPTTMEFNWSINMDLISYPLLNTNTLNITGQFQALNAVDTLDFLAQLQQSATSTSVQRTGYSLASVQTFNRFYLVFNQNTQQNIELPYNIEYYYLFATAINAAYAAGALKPVTTSQVVAIGNSCLIGITINALMIDTNPVASEDVGIMYEMEVFEREEQDRRDDLEYSIIDTFQKPLRELAFNRKDIEDARSYQEMVTPMKKTYIPSSTQSLDPSLTDYIGGAGKFEPRSEIMDYYRPVDLKPGDSIMDYQSPLDYNPVGINEPNAVVPYNYGGKDPETHRGWIARIGKYASKVDEMFTNAITLPGANALTANKWDTYQKIKDLTTKKHISDGAEIMYYFYQTLDAEDQGIISDAIHEISRNTTLIKATHGLSPEWEYLLNPELSFFKILDSHTSHIADYYQRVTGTPDFWNFNTDTYGYLDAIASPQRYIASDPDKAAITVPIGPQGAEVLLSLGSNLGAESYKEIKLLMQDYYKHNVLRSKTPPPDGILGPEGTDDQSIAPLNQKTFDQQFIQLLEKGYLTELKKTDPILYGDIVNVMMHDPLLSANWVPYVGVSDSFKRFVKQNPKLAKAMGYMLLAGVVYFVPPLQSSAPGIAYAIHNEGDVLEAIQWAALSFAGSQIMGSERLLGYQNQAIGALGAARQHVIGRGNVAMQRLGDLRQDAIAGAGNLQQRIQPALAQGLQFARRYPELGNSARQIAGQALQRGAPYVVQGGQYAQFVIDQAQRNPKGASAAAIGLVGAIAAGMGGTATMETVVDYIADTIMGVAEENVSLEMDKRGYSSEMIFGAGQSTRRLRREKMFLEGVKIMKQLSQKAKDQGHTISKRKGGLKAATRLYDGLGTALLGRRGMMEEDEDFGNPLLKAGRAYETQQMFKRARLS